MYIYKCTYAYTRIYMYIHINAYTYIQMCVLIWPFLLTHCSPLVQEEDVLREDLSEHSRATTLGHEPLDALLKQQLTYVSADDLEKKVHHIREVIDLNQDGSLNCKEFTPGLWMWDCSPPIYISTDNFLTMTKRLLDATACLDETSFTTMITVFVCI